MTVDGFAVVDKPAGLTSHDVVARARRALGERRIGHAGTLDPDATGVLLLGIGRGTRLLQFLSGASKSYTAEIVLGVETSTLDAAGEVTATHDMSAVTPADVVAAAARLTGDIDQVPPMVSALKVGGRRLHELARAGIEVERKARRVNVSRFSVERIEPLVYRAQVDCSSGTYVRTLAADLGHMLGGGAHLRALRRTAVGPFTEAEAQPLDALAVRPLLDALAGMAQVVVSVEVAAQVRHGRVLGRDQFPTIGVAGGPFAVLSPEGELLAVYVARPPDQVKPQVVLVPSGAS